MRLLIEKKKKKKKKILSPKTKDFFAHEIVQNSQTDLGLSELSISADFC
jgi:hypothetical protein